MQTSADAGRIAAQATPAHQQTLPPQQQQQEQRQQQRQRPQPGASDAAGQRDMDWSVQPGGGGGGGGHLEDYSSEDEAALGLETSAPDFYDPAADDKDEEWAAKLRGGRKSDALLSCPACLTTVCLDCQAHASEEGQFRAMFVMNSRVDTSRMVQPRPAGSGKRRRSRASHSEAAEGAASEEDQYHPVLCGLCDQDMGVWGIKDHVYHLFHVVPTHA